MRTGILDLICRAAAEGHDRHRIQAEMARRIAVLRDRLPRPPTLSSSYLQGRLTHPEHMDGDDASRVLAAMKHMIRTDDRELQCELVALNLLAARLGSAGAMVTLGAQVVAALQASPVPPKDKAPWDN